MNVDIINPLVLHPVSLMLLLVFGEVISWFNDFNWKGLVLELLIMFFFPLKCFLTVYDTFYFYFLWSVFVALFNLSICCNCFQKITLSKLFALLTVN